MSAFLFDGQDNSGKKLTDGKTFVTIPDGSDMSRNG
jgi:hypothetical protein